MADDRVRLCRMHPTSSGRPIRCIGSACGYHTADGACLIAGDYPPSRWQGRARVIAVPRDEYDRGERGYGETDGGVDFCDVGPAGGARQARPDLSRMDARQIDRYVRDHYDS